MWEYVHVYVQEQVKMCMCVYKFLCIFDVYVCIYVLVYGKGILGNLNFSFLCGDESLYTKEKTMLNN